MQNRLSLPVSRFLLGKGPALDARQRAALDWAEVDDHHAVLDVDCGGGELLLRLKERYSLRACGMVKAGESPRYDAEPPGQGLEILRADYTDIPWRDNSFDIVFITKGLRVSRQTDAFLQEVIRVLKPGGRLLSVTSCFLPSLPFGKRAARQKKESDDSSNPFSMMNRFELCGFTDVTMRYSRFRYATVIARKAEPVLFPVTNRLAVQDS